MIDAKTELEKMNDALDTLGQARMWRDEAKADKEKLLAKFYASDEWKRVNGIYEIKNMDAESLEAQIKHTILIMHNASMELPDRVQIKNFTVVTITDELKAKDWCIAHFTPALKLDSKVFEKAAKDGNIPAELAEVTKEARAQIATKL